ncbi:MULTISPECIES: hypothetical protein [unclassified Adlercreutzia]|uniref:hypothetical protein n=1 Tax=unclassified Adlercreutzia TaxID=2636013 RepID=UPI0013E9AC08|nr:MULTISPECIES: hypothetical protein [unclassified Adlercreutzia]
MGMEDIVERLDHVDVRAPREFSHTVTPLEREQGRIDWRVRNSENMQKMKTHTINDIYQK